MRHSFKLGLIICVLCALFINKIEAQKGSDKSGDFILQQERILIEDGSYFSPHLQRRITQDIVGPSHRRPFERLTVSKHDKKEPFSGRPWEKFRKNVGKNEEHSENKPISTAPLSDTLAPEWINYYASASLFSNDYPHAIAVDNDGNIYVTGSSDSTYSYMDCMTVKYDPTGVLQWKARYNSPGSFNDVSTAITIDASGNVYVTGYGNSAHAGMDFLTIKYNSSGAEQWTARYDGPAGSDDLASAIAVDESGNIYVTGDSYGSGSYSDFATVKYDASGTEQWTARYNGSANSYDYSNGIALDDSGNVYVGGYATGVSTHYDYVTIKYNSAGTEQWAAVYDGPSSSSDFLQAICTDGSGNIYVTGGSDSSGTSRDYTTIKYNSAGEEQWVVRYDGPRKALDIANAIAVDGAGNVIVTGFSEAASTSYDYATIKYNPSGVRQWVARYDGPGNYNDRASAIAVDGEGNVYVSGQSAANNDFPYNYDYATIKYDTSGNEQWVTRYDGPANSGDIGNAIASDEAGNVYVTGQSNGINENSDFATVKYNTLGIEQWAARYDGPGFSDDIASAITVDETGNIYLTGYSRNSLTVSDYITIKYNSGGVEQWAVKYNGPSNADDGAYAIAVDAIGNVYVTGYSYDSLSYTDYTTIKYNSSGEEQWTARYDGPGNSYDYANGIVVDKAGNVYVKGYSYDPVTDYDYAIIRYNSDGVEQWAARYNGPGNSEDYTSAFIVDDAGNVYVTGSSYDPVTSYDYATIKYNSSGVEQWTARYDGPASSSDFAYSIAIDAAGNIFVTGQSEGSGTESDYATVKYDSLGIEQWAMRYDGPESREDEAYIVACDKAGNAYVTGYSNDPNTGADFTTLKYSSSGVEQWEARYNGPGNSTDYAFAMTIDGVGNLYVTGTSEDSVTGNDFATVKYDSSGVEKWTARYNGPGNSYDSPTAIAVDGEGYVYVTGQSYKISGGVIVTIKYPQTLVAVDERQISLPAEYRLYQNYPNPFNPVTIVKYQLPVANWVTLKVYNLIGQEVKTLVNEFQRPGYKLVEWDANNLPSGIYMYRISAGTYTESRKMLLVK